MGVGLVNRQILIQQVCHGAAGSLNHFPRIQKLPVQRPHFRKQQRSSRASGIGRRRARQRGLRSCAGGVGLSRGLKGVGGKEALSLWDLGEQPT